MSGNGFLDRLGLPGEVMEAATTERRGSAPVDPLAALSDDFEGAESDPLARGWSYFDSARIEHAEVTGGQLYHYSYGGGGGHAQRSFWFSTNRGYLIYKAIEGDCRARAIIRARNEALSANPAPDGFNSKVCALQALDPDTASLDYVLGGTGIVGGNLCAMYQHCRNGSSGTSGGTNPGYDDAITPWPAGGGNLDAEVELQRVGQVFTVRVREVGAGDESWQTILSVDRAAAPMPSTLYWGLTVYASVVASDVAMLCDRIDFSTPS